MGEVGYLNSELSKLLCDGLKYGGMAAYWIKDGCEKFKHIEKTILDLMHKESDEINTDFGRFSAQLYDFLKIYFQWENLKAILYKAQRRNDSIELSNIFNPNIKQQWQYGLNVLLSYNIKSHEEWEQKDFAAICYYIYSAKTIDGKRYIDTQSISFASFVKSLSIYFNRERPSTNPSKAQKAWDTMQHSKKERILKLFK